MCIVFALVVLYLAQILKFNLKSIQNLIQAWQKKFLNQIHKIFNPEPEVKERKLIQL